MGQTVEIANACTCGSIGQTGLRQCPVDYHIWNGDVRLTSVRRIVSMLPQKPCESCGAQGYRDHLPGCKAAEKIEEARVRGKQVDELFTRWVRRGLPAVPKETRDDSEALLRKLTTWFNQQHFRSVEAQLLVGDAEVGGIADLVLDGYIWDVKCTYDVTLAHRLQVAGYAEVSGFQAGGVLHATKRFVEPRAIRTTDEDMESWHVLRGYWKMCNELGLVSQ